MMDTMMDTQAHTAHTTINAVNDVVPVQMPLSTAQRDGLPPRPMQRTYSAPGARQRRRQIQRNKWDASTVNDATTTTALTSNRALHHVLQDVVLQDDQHRLDHAGANHNRKKLRRRHREKQRRQRSSSECATRFKRNKDALARCSLHTPRRTYHSSSSSSSSSTSARSMWPPAWSHQMQNKQAQMQHSSEGTPPLPQQRPSQSQSQSSQSQQRSLTPSPQNESNQDDNDNDHPYRTLPQRSRSFPLEYIKSMFPLKAKKYSDDKNTTDTQQSNSNAQIAFQRRHKRRQKQYEQMAKRRGQRWSVAEPADRKLRRSFSSMATPTHRTPSPTDTALQMPRRTVEPSHNNDRTTLGPPMPRRRQSPPRKRRDDAPLVMPQRSEPNLRCPGVVNIKVRRLLNEAIELASATTSQVEG